MLTEIKCACGAVGLFAFEDDRGRRRSPLFCPFCSRPLPGAPVRRCLVCGVPIIGDRDVCPSCAPELALGR